MGLERIRRGWKSQNGVEEIKEVMERVKGGGEI